MARRKTNKSKKKRVRKTSRAAVKNEDTIFVSIGIEFIFGRG